MPGLDHVYDLGYYDYGWWAGLDDAGCRFVTRLKKNTPFSVVKENRVGSTRASIVFKKAGLPGHFERRRASRFCPATTDIFVRN